MLKHYLNLAQIIGNHLLENVWRNAISRKYLRRPIQDDQESYKTFTLEDAKLPLRHAVELHRYEAPNDMHQKAEIALLRLRYLAALPKYYLEQQKEQA